MREIHRENDGGAAASVDMHCGRGERVARILSGVTPEITTVAEDEVVIFCGSTPVVHSELEPSTTYRFGDIEVNTLDRPGGELLCRFATVNDVHFGETRCGVIEGTDIGPVFTIDDGEPPYPETMNRAAVAEIAAIDPVAVVVKGDLTANGTDEEYAQFLDCYAGAFGDRLHHVRGNHDSYHGGTYAAFAHQEVHLPGVTLAILDTSREARANGDLSADQLDWLDELGARADQPVVVFGHHHIWHPHSRHREDSYFGIVPDASEALIEVMSRRPRLVGYFAGHTHRNRRVDIDGVPYVEVACVKDFPGAWAEYRVYEGGIVHLMRRIADPDALSWTERTRHMYEGAYADYAFGPLEARSFVVDTGA